MSVRQRLDEEGGLDPWPPWALSAKQRALCATGFHDEMYGVLRYSFDHGMMVLYYACGCVWKVNP